VRAQASATEARRHGGDGPPWHPLRATANRGAATVRERLAAWQQREANRSLTVAAPRPSRLWPVLLLALAFTAHASTPAPDLAGKVAVRATIHPPTTTIGTPFRYQVAIDAPKEAELVIPLLGERFGDFSVTDFGDEPPTEENGRVRVLRWFTLVGWQAGDFTLPPYPLKYKLAGSEELQSAEANEVTVVVESLLPKAPTPVELRDIAEPEALPFDWRPVLYASAALVALGLLLALLSWWSRRQRAASLAPQPKPHEVALAALQKLRSQHLLESGRLEEFYVALSAIVRTYVEGRFGLHAPERTTEEFLAEMQRDRRLTAEHRTLLGEFLGESDLVKFARHQPAPEDGERAWSAARRFVDESREGGAPAEGEAHAAA